MSKLYQTENNIPLDPIFESFADTVSKLNISETEIELQKRGLIESGTLRELKVRLLQYLNGESRPTDFISYKEQNSE